MGRTRECPHCDRTLPSTRALEDHVQRAHSGEDAPTNWTPILVGVLAVLAAGAVGAALILGGGPSTATSYHVEQSPRTGQADAPVTLVAFESPACPNCQRFHLGSGSGPSVYERLLDTYVEDGDVRYVEKFARLGYAWERPAANAQRCAWHQAGWSAFHDLTQAIYRNQADLSGSNLASFVEGWAEQSADVDPSAIGGCLEERRHDGDLTRDLQDGEQAGVSGTPTFIVVSPTGTTEQIAGPQPFSTFETAIEDALARAPEDPGTAEDDGNGDANASNGDASSELASTPPAPAWRPVAP